MRNKACFVALIGILSFGLTLAWVLGEQTSSGIAASPMAELHVCPSGCTYDNVQDAVDAANEADIIKVAEGTYTGVSFRDGVTQTVYLSKTLTIQGGYTTSNWDSPNPEVYSTTLDAQGLGRVFYIKGGNTPTIAGLHITGGNALGLEPNEEGGGIYTHIDIMYGEGITILKDNHVYNNTARDGGGAYLSGRSNYTLSGFTFDSNTASERGGGLVIAIREATPLTNNVFTGNSAARGGGLAVLGSDVLLRGNRFLENSAGEAGGGLYVEYSAFESEADIIMNNSAGRGGGLAMFNPLYDQPWRENYMINTLIAYNVSTVEGSGIYIGGSLLHLWHTTLVDNTGGEDGSTGITISTWNTDQTSKVELRNTIVATETSGIKVQDASTVYIDSILWFADAINLTEVPEADVSLVNQLLGDPDFADPVYGDFHIGPASAARDAGVPSGVTIDIDSQPRPMGPAWDLGADEFFDMYVTYLPLSLRN